MDAEAILKIMEDYVVSEQLDHDASDLASQTISDVLTSSITVVEFVMHLEEELELQEDIDLDALAPKFAQDMTFADLAQEVVQYLESGTA